MLSSESSNRSTSQIALEIMYSDIIIPLQDRILKQLKNHLIDWFNDEKNEECWKWITIEDINTIDFEDINLKNPKEEMETLTWYQKNGILSVNEVREIAELWEAIEWGDDYKIISWNSVNNTDEEKEMEKIKNEIKKIYETN